MDRYDNSIIEKTKLGYQYKKAKVYPNLPLSDSDEYIITTIGDRLDLLAYSYYNDSTLWWIIAMANNNVNNGFMYVTPGTQLRIPTNLNEILTLYSQFNQAR